MNKQDQKIQESLNKIKLIDELIAVIAKYQQGGKSNVR